MRVKWQRKKSEAESKAVRFRLVAYLTDEYLDGDTTKQKNIAQLGSIEERFLTSPVCTMREFHQGLFWSAVDKRLDCLDLDEDTRAEIEAQILKKVHRPGAEWALWGVICMPQFDPC